MATSTVTGLKEAHSEEMGSVVLDAIMQSGKENTHADIKAELNMFRLVYTCEQLMGWRYQAVNQTHIQIICFWFGDRCFNKFESENKTEESLRAVLPVSVSEPLPVSRLQEPGGSRRVLNRAVLKDLQRKK
ncbi:hypothetical protein EYF80_009339 [Liparis tanakae]|uniref:Uncharacterized protein n=1 Tax=Liparis tanakae TaxID=230148 RepID=A0A4Z2IQX5_9TELE|nr:hypothetical protein EYF80_009339 [Liparis tanakae]